jgi:Arc/MetJ family transcription regulator
LLNESQEHIIRSLKVVFPDFVRKGDRKLIVADGIRQKAVSRRQGSVSHKRIAHSCLPALRNIYCLPSPYPYLLRIWPSKIRLDIHLWEDKIKTLVDISEDIFDEAMRLSDARTKREVIHMALDELIKARLRQKLKGLAGSGIMETKLSDLKRIRRKRENNHRTPRIVRR